jgi:serine phosphatase RsbU (regulator of sigma subunit)
MPNGDGSARRALRDIATITAAELVSRGQYTDLLARVRRSRPMSLAAELQWQALPPNAFATTEVSVAGMMEPAYAASGDAFDYSHDERGLSFAIFDAVGHDLDSTLISTLAIGAYRNRRRAEEGLEAIAVALDDAIAEQLGGERYCTGLLAELDDSTGALTWLNAGHPLPLLVRAGRVVKELECRPRPPFGLGSLVARPPEIASVHLEPGDAVFLYTDGIIEARSSDGVDFGLERLERFLLRAFADQLSPAETLRRLSNAVLDHHGGVLRDDASTLLVGWHPRGTADPSGH